MVSLLRLHKASIFDTINPATEKKIASVANAGASDVDKAVKAARACT
jgi:acyl-CoA reductase-like NAD-dependent aldehyde dehydrogenase